jgi:serine/threonine-protein kinase
MEWLRGRDLEEVGGDRTPLPPADVVLYLRQVARALDKAHVLGIIHRDLKPENLFLTTRDDGTPCVKILDFGIAKLKETGDESANFKATGTGQIFGTPLYMSPEQTTAALDKVGPQTDIWALGIIAHRLLTGTEPWNAPTLTALIAQIAFLPLPVPSEHGHDLGPGFDAWFARCCAKEPLDRFPTAGEAIAELALAVGVSEESARMSVPSASQSTVVRPPREDSARTAFSATAPAPSAITADPGETAPPRRAPPSMTLMVLGACVTIALGAAGILAYASSRPTTSPTVIVPPDATAIHAAEPSATPVTIVTPAPTTPVVSAEPSASAPPDPKRPPPIRVGPDPLTTVRHAPTTPPPPTAPPPVAPPPATPAITAPPAPTAPPPPPDPLGTRH